MVTFQVKEVNFFDRIVEILEETGEFQFKEKLSHFKTDFEIQAKWSNSCKIGKFHVKPIKFHVKVVKFQVQIVTF